MLPGSKRSDAVIDEARGTAPHRDVTAFEAEATHGIGATFPAPEEYGGQAERNGNDWSPLIVLVAVLMKAELRAGYVTIDQARVRIVICEPGLGGRADSNVEKMRRHGRPGNPRLGIVRIVTVARLVRYPTDTAA